jgi:hypothetical protein
MPAHLAFEKDPDAFGRQLEDRIAHGAPLLRVPEKMLHRPTVIGGKIDHHPAISRNGEKTIAPCGDRLESDR